jgi:hypothetical protein
VSCAANARRVLELSHNLNNSSASSLQPRLSFLIQPTTQFFFALSSAPQSLFTMAKSAAKSTPLRAGRGRPKKADVFGAAPVVATDPPKKRGRPSTVAAVINEPLVELEPTPVMSKKRGRPSKAAAAKVVEDAPQPTPKSKTAAAETIAIPPKKRAGRPAKAATASSLNRVAGSPRVSKRAPAKRASTAATAKPVARIDPRVRSKLRTRNAPVKKGPAPIETPKKPAKRAKQETASVQPPKKRGRPAAATKTATKATAGSGRGRPRKDASAQVDTKKAPVATKKAPKTARQAISKPVAPRKRRGYTTLEVPDKFAAQIQQHLLDLEAAEEAPEEAADEEAEEEQEHIFQDQDVNAEVTPVDEDENAKEDAQEEVQLVVVVKPAEEETYEEGAEDFAGEPDETAGEIEVEYEIREETIIEEPTNQEFQMQGDIEDVLNRAVSSELTPSYDDDFEESAHDTSILQQSMGANDASGLFA